MKTFQFIVTYTNDVRRSEIKARCEFEAKILLEARAKKALLKIVSIELENIL